MINGADPFDFAALTVAHDEANAFDAVVPPIVQTSLFTFGSYDEMVAAYRTGEKRRADFPARIAEELATAAPHLARPARPAATQASGPALRRLRANGSAAGGWDEF